MATTAARPNTHDMVVIHRVFRREFRLMPALVRSVAPGHVDRAKTVASHATELTVALHHHHTGEDELLWPRLRERVDLDNALEADLIDRMEAAHHEIATLLDRAGPMIPQLAARAEAPTRDELAEIFDAISPALDAHLAEEEERILPLAEQYMSVEEWAELGTRGMASIPKDRLLVFLGHILEETTPQERAEFLGHVPLPGRIAFKLVGQRKYQREVDTLRAGVPDQRQA